jgi:mRNA interferase MazF
MNIRQGEIWMINFDPSVGSEIQKKRPAVVINDNNMRRFGFKYHCAYDRVERFF